MEEKINTLKEIERENYIRRIKEDKENLIMLISDVLGIDKKYVKKHITNIEESPYDLITTVTSNYIKIKTSKYNKIIKNIEENKFYKKTYNEEKGYYKIKIDINKIYDEYFEMVLEKELNEMSKDFKEKSKEELLDLCTVFSLMSRIPKDELKNNIEISKESDKVTRIRIAIPI